MWYVVPIIRSQLAISLVKDHKMRQSQVARTMGVTDAAISQYLSKKRAKITINDEKIMKEVRKSAKKIIKSGQQDVVKEEICRLCKLINESDMMEELTGGCEKCP